MPMPHTLRTLSLRCAARSQPLLGGQGAAPSPGTSPARAREPPGPFGCGARGAQHRLGMSTAQQPCSPWHTPHGDPSPSPSPRPHLGLLPKTWEEPVQGGCRGGAQAPCTPWLQGADPWSRSPVVQSITSTTSTTTPALPAGNTCAGRSERGNPPPVPSRPAGRKRCRAQQWQRPAGCACASSPCSTAAPWHGTAPHGRAVPVAPGSSLVHLWQGPGAATLGLSPDGISPALRGSPLRILQAAPLASCLAGDPRPSLPHRRWFSLTPAAEGARRPRPRHAAAQR